MAPKGTPLTEILLGPGRETRPIRRTSHSRIRTAGVPCEAPSLGLLGLKLASAIGLTVPGGRIMVSSNYRDRDRDHDRGCDRLTRQLGDEERDRFSCSARDSAEPRLASLFTRGPIWTGGRESNSLRFPCAQPRNPRRITRSVTRSNANQTSGMRARCG